MLKSLICPKPNQEKPEGKAEELYMVIGELVNSEDEIKIVNHTYTVNFVDN